MDFIVSGPFIRGLKCVLLCSSLFLKLLSLLLLQPDSHNLLITHRLWESNSFKSVSKTSYPYYCLYVQFLYFGDRSYHYGVSCKQPFLWFR